MSINRFERFEVVFKGELPNGRQYVQATFVSERLLEPGMGQALRNTIRDIRTEFFRGLDTARKAPKPEVAP